MKQCNTVHETVTFKKKNCSQEKILMGSLYLQKLLTNHKYFSQ